MKSNKFSAIIIMLLFMIGCKAKVTEDFLTVETTQLVFSAQADSRIIPCASNAAVKLVSSQPTWCTATVVDVKNGKEIVVSASRNEGVGADQVRTATITVTAGKAKAVQIEAKQASQGAVFNLDGDRNLQFSAAAAQKSFMLQTNVSLEIFSSDNTWCTAERQGQYLIINVTRNDDESERTATVTVAASGFEDVEIKIIQDGSNWKLTWSDEFNTAAFIDPTKWQIM